MAAVFLAVSRDQQKQQDDDQIAGVKSLGDQLP